MRFGLVQEDDFLRHDTGAHVENPGRLKAIAAELASSPLPLEKVASRLASDEELTALHAPSLVERLEAVSARGGGWLDGDTFCSPASAEVARRAAGSAIELTRLVTSGDLERGFALLRPPGHHATPDRSMGFCLYSNIALAAHHAGVERVLIFDWDVHHGNGTQDCLYRHPATVFMSLHQSPFYPGTGHPEERGEGPGAGSIYNLPLPAGCADAEYLWAMEQLLDPLLERTDPDLILLSAGYDAHQRDPLGGMAVSTEGFRQMAARLDRWSRRGRTRGRLVGLLEGGYDPRALAASVRATLEAWLEPVAFEPIKASQVSSPVRHLVERLRQSFLGP
ncbi:histone deacetylase [bacterium CPR1]|nr:histone deacetylase [bacterium CPR1]